MKLKITINMDNAAFEGRPGSEVYRILKRLAGDLVDMADGEALDIRLRDINGNAVGNCEVTI